MSISSETPNFNLSNMQNNSVNCNNGLYFDGDTPPNYSEEFLLKKERALKGTEERFLNGDNTDDEGWRSEALAVIADINKFVQHIDISICLPCDENGIYLNLQTKEGACLTVELSAGGFRVCGFHYDTLSPVDVNDVNDQNKNAAVSQSEDLIQLNVYYETPYALLDSISPAYRDCFSTELAQRLQELCN